MRERLVFFLFRSLSYLPLSVLHGLGGVVGCLIWLGSPGYRRIMHTNMALAFGEAEAQRLRFSAAAHAGRQSLELPKIWLRPHDEVVARVVRVSGREVLDAALAQGQGIIFLAPHLGCFEVVGRYLSTLAPITSLYRRPKKAWMQGLVEAGRVRGQSRLAPADLGGVRMLIKALRKGETVGILPDQAPKAGEGRWLDFFGKPAYTMTLAARLTDCGAAVIMVWAERLPDGAGYHLHLTRPSRAFSGTTEERAAQINSEVETLVRRCPEQYLWAYNRYKRPRGADAPPEND